jgi:sulfite exporter TauE/SafE/copper chaperone CopZ
MLDHRKIVKRSVKGAIHLQASEKSCQLRIGGMTCQNCQNKIERKLRSTPGVRSAHVSFGAGTANITYDAAVISLQEIAAIIQKLNYRVLPGNGRQQPKIGRVIGILAIVVALYVVLQQFGILNLLVPSQLADVNMGYGMLFVIGLITSLHCMAMCGGINLSQCLPRGDTPEETGISSSIRPALLYNLGRVISYTSVGFILGSAGYLLGGGLGLGMPTLFQGILKLIAGVFMVLMGINMLGIFPGLRKFQLNLTGSLTSKLGAAAASSRRPLMVGLLNGLMPCGPLQSMQIVALASGNPLAGALSMFLFSLGTVPLMLGLGSLVSLLGQKYTRKMMSVGAMLVVVLGLAMLSQGGSLSGFLPPDVLLVVILSLGAVGIVTCLPFRKPSYKAISALSAAVLVIMLFTAGNWLNAGPAVNAGSSTQASSGTISGGIQVINSTLTASRYPNIVVQAGTPVKWIIDAPKGSINGCNSRMLIQNYGIEYAFKPGANVIEFTPEKTGTFRYSCWMGMIHGTITVSDKASP